MEYEQRQGWIATGIIFGTMIPLVVILLCFFYKYRQRIKELEPIKRFDSSWKRNVTDRIQNAPKSFRDSLFTPNKKKPDKRSYDRSYRTNEPKQPEIDFNDREPDLSNVDDRHIEAFEKHAGGRYKPVLNDEDDISVSTISDDYPNVERDAVSSGDSSDDELKKDKSVSSKTPSAASLTEENPPDSPKSSTNGSTKNYRSSSSSPMPDFMKPSRFKRESSSDSSDIPRHTTPPIPPAPKRAPSTYSSGRSSSSKDSSSDSRASKKPPSVSSAQSSKGTAIQTAI